MFWDDRYLDAHCQFIQRLGKYLDGREGLEFVDIGGIGEWGEMHLGLHIQGRWTPQQLEETGFTRDKYGGTPGWPSREEAARFDLLDVSASVGHSPVFASEYGNTWQTLKHLNPHICVFLYQNGPCMYNTASWGKLGEDGEGEPGKIARIDLVRGALRRLPGEILLGVLTLFSMLGGIMPRPVFLLLLSQAGISVVMPLALLGLMYLSGRQAIVNDNRPRPAEWVALTLIATFSLFMSGQAIHGLVTDISSAFR